MNKTKLIALGSAVLVLVLAITLILFTQMTPANGSGIIEVPAEKDYTYVNPEVVKAEPDAGIVIDGVLDEEVYKNSNWLYLYNDEGGNKVNIAMTSHYGEKGMYFVYDVTESVPIYVNPERDTYMNSCIEMYLAPSYASSMQDNDVFEIDLMPTGDMLFKRGNGKLSDTGSIGYGNVASTNDIMARLGATTKGGEVNTESCKGYCLEFFIPWDYMQWLGVDVDALKNGHVYVNPAHITSYNYAGKDAKIDRFWYHYAKQNGAKFADVTKYFRFSGQGVVGAVPVTLQPGEHYTISGATNIMPGLDAFVNIMPDEGYALTSILINGEEQIQKVSFNEDGSVTLKLSGTSSAVTVSATATAVSSGTKTLSGKVVLNNIVKDTLDGLVLSYTGPKGEQPLVIDANGQFELKDLEQGNYVLKATKNGYKPVSYNVYLNKDTYTEIILEYDYFQVTMGSCWILDEQNKGILYKKEGIGQILGTVSYEDFTFWANLKYDPNVATLGDTDEHKQQRSGVQIRFSNGKSWHIDLLKQKDSYILQYARISGDNSLFDWKTIHTLTEAQIAKYTGKDGINLTIKRKGNEVAICLDDTILAVEELATEYKGYSAQLGLESWIANKDIMKISYGIKPSASIPAESKPIFYTANSWDISSQHLGYIIKTGIAGNYSRLNAALIANSITTTCVDQSPDTADYAMIYVFNFSNGEKFWVRLHHTDKDGKYRIQSMDGSTVFDAWKSKYTLTDEQVAKIQKSGIDFRVQVVRTTAYVYLDGQQVCAYDLSKNVSTGEPSGIGESTVTVSLRLDGNIGKDTKVPFKLVQDTKVENPVPTDPVIPDNEKPFDPSKQVTINIGSMSNGTVTLTENKYSIGQIVTLTVTPAEGYAQKLYIDGEPLLLNWKTNTYSFEATKNVYNITGSFVPSIKATPKDTNRWDTANQAHGILNAYYPDHNDSWLMYVEDTHECVTVKAKNYLLGTDGTGVNEFSTVIGFKMSNGKEYTFRVVKQNDKYYYQRFGIGGNDWTKKELDQAAITAILGDGAELKLERTAGNMLTISVNGVVYDNYIMSNVTEADTVSNIVMGHYGNKGQVVTLPFTVADAVYLDTIFIASSGEWNLDEQHNGKITILNKLKDGTTVSTIANTYKEVSVTVKDYTPSKNEDGSLKQGGFAMQITFAFDNGKQYQVRLHNTDKDGNYKLQNMGGDNNITGWKWQADLTSAQKEKLLNSDGVKFTVKLVGANAELYVDDTLMKTVELGTDYSGKTAQIKLCMNGNKNGTDIEIPFELK